MQKAINRFWDWLFHPSVRPYINPNAKANVYRYPSPGNAINEIPQDQQNQDYKTPYAYSKHSVRYTNPVPSQTYDQVQQFKFDPLSLNPIIKLKRVGLLKNGQQSNPDALSKAKQKYQEIYKFPVEQSIYRNDAQSNILRSTNRQEVSAYVQNFYQNLRQAKKTEYDYMQNRKTIDDPQIVPLQSVDMYTYPSVQQSRIQNQYQIERQIKNAVKQKHILTNVGDANFWKAIDNSFPLEEVQKVQKHIGDLQPTNFNLQSSSKIQLEINKEGKVVDVHPKH